MSGPEMTAIASATGMPWIVWEPFTPSSMAMMGLGIAACLIGITGLWMMRTGSKHRDRQIDAQTMILTTQTETLKSLNANLDAQTASLKAMTATLNVNTEALVALVRRLEGSAPSGG